MSFAGFRSRIQNSSANVSADRGITTPQRDAWNQPIEPPPQNNNNNNTNNNDNNNNNNNNNNTNRNNDGINDDAIDKIWADIKKEGSQPGDLPPNNQQPNNNQTQLTPAEQMNKYLKDQGLDPIVLSDQMKEQIQAGDMTGLLTELNTKITLAHTKALSNSSLLIDEKIKNAMAEIRKESVNYVEGGKSLEALKAAVPAANDPALSPVLQTVMQKLLDKGASREDAIKGTKLWMNRLVKNVDPDFDPNARPNRNRNGNFGDVSVDGENDGRANWLDVLSGRADT